MISAGILPARIAARIVVLLMRYFRAAWTRESVNAATSEILARVKRLR
jgi:hypothetical protein